MTTGDRLVASVFALSVLMFVGMVASSWRMILYPYLVMVGVIILLGVGRKAAVRKLGVYCALGVGIIYVLVHVWLDVVFSNRDTAELHLVGGLEPSTAIYFFVIWPLGLLVALLYSWMAPRLLADELAAADPPSTGDAGSEGDNA